MAMMQGTLTRRGVLAMTGASAVAGLGPTIVARPARAKADTLSIAQGIHVVPAFDEWFERRFAKAWGQRHGLRVVVDYFSASQLRARALAEIAAQRGHDLFGLAEPAASFEAHVLPLNDVVSECERRFGKLGRIAQRATYNPRSQKYFALATAWAPSLLHYRADWWDGIGVVPDTWEQVREGARRIKDKHGAHAGFGLAPEHDSDMMLRGLLWSFGAAEQDDAGRVAINSRETVEALKLMTAIFKESMTSEVFMWDPSSNSRFFVWGRGSIIQNGISALRTAEHLNPDVARRAAVAPAARGPGARLAAAHAVHCYVLWKFARNPELAKKFLVDLVEAAGEVFAASEFCNLPTFSNAVPDVRARLAADRQNPKAYPVLAEAEAWSACPGHPGYASAAIDEVVHAHVIPQMFARAAQGEQSPDASARQAEAEMKRIFARWAK
jgi:multiple sugar transport system substrate-binding protein